MIISKQGYYLLKVVLLFAFSNKGSFSTKEISRRLEISEKILEQVLLNLKNEGLLSSKRGPNGGYTLIKDVSEMTVMDVIDLTGKKLSVIPVDVGKNKIIDEIIKGISSDIKKSINEKVTKLKMRDLVTQMKKKITKKDLSYTI